MPNQADIVVKKADGVTNVTYVGVAPSAGDKTPAIWRLSAASPKLGFQPIFTMKTAPNANGTFRHANFAMTFPVIHTDTPTGLVVLDGNLSLDAHMSLDANLSTTDYNEAFAQFGNLIVSTLIRSSIGVGYSPS